MKRDNIQIVARSARLRTYKTLPEYAPKGNPKGNPRGKLEKVRNREPVLYVYDPSVD